jgi:hypothetical protein
VSASTESGEVQKQPDVADSEPGAPSRAHYGRVIRVEALLAVVFFAILCVVVLTTAPHLLEPDDYAYRGSVVAMSQGHFLTLSTAQVRALAVQLGGPMPSARGPGGPTGIPQWVQLSDGRWISEKDPGYPFLAVVFQALGIIRLAPLFYGALASIGLYLGAQRWLGRFGGAAAVGLYCSSGTALLFAWRDYMPTFIDASLIAAGTGALLWAVLAVDVSIRRRTCAGLAGFVALEAATFTRYTDVVVLGCAVVAVITAWRLPAAKLPFSALAWWLGSAVVFCAGVGLFDTLVYGGPLRSGYRPGEVQFSLSAIIPNLRLMPRDLIWTTPMYALGLAALAWIIVAWTRIRGGGGEHATVVRRDLAVGLSLAASWLALWGLYSAYTWTAPMAKAGSLSTLVVYPLVRFYVPALGLIALLGAWLMTHVPRKAAPPVVAVVAVVGVMFGLGLHSFDVMDSSAGALRHAYARCVAVPVKGRPAPTAGRKGRAKTQHVLRCAIARHAPGPRDHRGHPIGPKKQQS